MKMISSLILLMMIPGMAMANAKVVGNGGVVVACRGVSGEIEKVELYDLYEGRALLNVTPVETGADYVDAARTKIKTFNSLMFDLDFGGVVLDNLDYIVKNLSMLPPGVGLKLTEDMASILIPKKCEFAQLINYRNDGKIYVDSDLWNLMTDTGKAAALLHETIYYYLRLRTEKDSSRVRKAVAYLFANVPMEKVLSDKNDFRCESERGETIFNVVVKDGVTKGEFERLNGQYMISRSEVTFEQEDGIQFLKIQSMTRDGVVIAFIAGTPTMEKVGIDMMMNVNDTNYDLHYNVKYKCYDR